MFVLPSLGLGGAERQAFLLARHLSKQTGALVTIVGFGEVGGLADLCDRERIPWLQFHLRHGYRDHVGHLRDLVAFTRFLRHHRVDILLPYCMFQNVLCGLTWRMGGARVCIWNQRDEGRSRVLARWIERLAVLQVSSFVSNSDHGAQFLLDVLRVNTQQVRVIHNGVCLESARLDRAGWRRQTAVPPDAFVACMIANLHGFKDHATLISAWRSVVDRLKSRGRQSCLLLAGLKSDRYQAIQRQVDATGLHNDVQFLGPVDDVTGLLEAVDVAVLSSTAEGLPNVVLEAMAAGRAVIATDSPGIREIAGSASVPLIVRPHDPGDLADAVVRTAEDSQLRTELEERGRARVAEGFTVDRMCREMVEHIDRELCRSR